MASGISDETKAQARSKFRILNYFSSDHLRASLQEVAKPIEEIAYRAAVGGGAQADPQETAAGLRKLLEAKDCLVRAQLTANQNNS